MGHGPATYQLASLAHGHFICEDCGATLEAPDEMFRGLAHTVKTKLGFSIDPHHFAMLGVCAACARRAAALSPLAQGRGEPLTAGRNRSRRAGGSGRGAGWRRRARPGAQPEESPESAHQVGHVHYALADGRAVRVTEERVEDVPHAAVLAQQMTGVPHRLRE